MKVFLWTFGLDDFINGKGIVGGITVQMYFWSQLFYCNGWKVQSLTINRKASKKTLCHINFTWRPTIRFITPLVELLIIFSIAVFHRPDLVIARGASRTVFFLALFCHLFHIKFVLMFASDSDLIPGKEIVHKFYEKILFEYGVHLCRYFVCQNLFQQEMLKKYYNINKRSTIIPNIWFSQDTSNQNPRNTILWVANLRKLKRPEMFLHLAESFPDERFVMAGGGLDSTFQKIQDKAKKMPNLFFHGLVSFQVSQKLFSEARCFVCSSEFEGFPNTFLQAFSNGIPVISTVDPSGIIQKYNLGYFVKDQKEMEQALKDFLNSPEKQKEFRESVQRFFLQNYSPQPSFEKLQSYLFN